MERVKTVPAIVVTEPVRRPALLSVDDELSDALPVLMIEGVAQAPGALPVGTYLVVDDPEMADRAVLAGYTTEPPRTATRRRYRYAGRFYASFLLFGAVGSVIWAVVALLALDLLGVLKWLGLAVFVGALGLLWWYAGEEIGLGEEAEQRTRARAFWARINAIRGVTRSKR